MTTLRLILGDHLSRDIATFDGLDRANDIVLMVEVAAETTYVRHHKQKIALILSAMRHFAEDLVRDGIRVDYVRLDARENTGSFTGELIRAVERHRPTGIVVTEPGEWRVLDMMRHWQTCIDVPIEIRQDNRFFASRARFAAWAAGRKSYRMEYFYRDMRRESGLMMEGDKPVGGNWNFDAENRKPLPDQLRPPARPSTPPDPITRDVLDLVADRFPDHFGDLEPFRWAVTRDGALRALAHFISDCLPTFGDYQDAMKRGEPFLFHAVISPYLNIGLLGAREVCLAAEAAYRAGTAPLNAVEGFIRQILGWREYIRGIYWLKMPDYAQTNALDATRPLPEFFWSGQTKLACIAETVVNTRANAYAHHIQRLMVTGNFALLAGIAPSALEEWYLAVYADAFEWVELPNVHGMVLFADGGVLASKPYAASGAYIDRMSDYCAGCAYDPNVKLGPGACPFNLLYWTFLITHRKRLGGNPRLAMPYRTLDRMTDDRRSQIVSEAMDFLANLDSGQEDKTAPAQGKLGFI